MFKCAICVLAVGEVHATGHAVEVIEPVGASVVLPLKGKIVSEAGSGVTHADASTGALPFSPGLRRTRVVAPGDGACLGLPVIITHAGIMDAAERMNVPPRQPRSVTSLNLELALSSQPVSGELVNLCRGLHSGISRGAARLDRSEPKARWSATLSEKVVELLEEADVFDLPRSVEHSSNRRHVRRAMEYMRAHFGDIAGMGEVAGACGVSNRRLEHAFRTAMQINPMQALTMLRLEQARAMLRDPDGGAGVSEVALACGFRALGRFSRVCAERSGARPSETWSRS